MTSVAYIAFTFLACVLGLGFGLWLHRLHLKKVAMPDIASMPDDDSTFDALSQWQARENRSFGLTMSACVAAPVVFAAFGWTSRGEVVSTLCSGITTVVSQTPLCL